MKKFILSIIFVLFVLSGISFADVRDCQIDLNRYLKDKQNPGIIFGKKSQINHAKYMQFMHKGLRLKLEKKKENLLTIFVYTPKNYFNDKKTIETEAIFGTFGIVLSMSSGLCVDENIIIEYIIIRNKKIIKFGYQEMENGTAEWRKTRLKNPIAHYLKKRVEKEKAIAEQERKEREYEKAQKETSDKKIAANNERIKKEELEQEAINQEQRDKVAKNKQAEALVDGAINIFKKLW